MLDRSLEGAIAIEVDWTSRDDAIHVASCFRLTTSQPSANRGPSDLRGALRLAFGEVVSTHKWVPLAQRSETDERDWCEQAIDAWIAGGIRDVEKANSSVGKGGNAWAIRKNRKRERASDRATAREHNAKVSE